MGRIEGLWVRNYGVLKQVGIGSCFLQFAYVNDDSEFLPFPLGPTTIIAGANGTGKSTFFDIFTFLADTFRYGVDKAMLKRGGYEAVYTQGGEGPISIGINYRQDDEELPVTYALSIERDINGKAFIETEMLAYREGTTPFPVLYLQNGAQSIRYITPDERIDGADLNRIEFTDYRHLGLSQLAEHPAYPAFKSVRQLIEDVYLSNFSTDIGRGLSLAATAKFVNPRGSSLAALVQFMAERYADTFSQMLDRLVPLFPQITGITIQNGLDGKPLLFFQQGGVWLPATRMSDGFLRLFTYLLILEDPLPAPLLCIEEPENGLDRVACWRLVDELIKYANPSTRPGMTSQLFISTHHPGIVDAVKPESVWVFEPNRSGFTTANRACDDLVIQNVWEQQRELPNDWFSQFFESKL